jgi:hypothetical protein
MTEIRIIMLAALLVPLLDGSPQNMPKNTPAIYQHISRNVA